MPIYKWKCGKCNEVVEDFRPMKDHKKSCTCPCGKVLTFEDRDFTMKRTNAPADCPRVSTALGIHPSQIGSKEVEAVHPGAKFNPNGDMILRNRAEQKQRLLEKGWVNKDSY
ncbi:hypothetical protein LCGC14_2725080 [marine sediment metagenome]|uniref:Uncharacterized protein n=1 Tax=marine sediment metagenome TaxID=412755 RepID=A0A0F8Z909_9ZZZZ